MSFILSIIELHFSFPKLFLLCLYLISMKSYLNLKLQYSRILFMRKPFQTLFDQLFLATGI